MTREDLKKLNIRYITFCKFPFDENHSNEWGVTFKFLEDDNESFHYVDVLNLNDLKSELEKYINEHVK